MRKYTIYGNCQAHTISLFLNSVEEFSREYQYIELEPVQSISIESLSHFTENILPTLDLFIHQPVKPTFRNNPNFASDFLLSKLNPNCLVISFHSMFFRGYNPELFPLKNIPHFRYRCHDINMMRYFCKYQTLNLETFKDYLYSNDFYDQEFSEEVFEENIKELERREKISNIDITIGEYIRQTGKTKRLFHIVHHPSTALFKYVAKSILARLQIHEEVNYEEEVLDQTIYPIYESQYKNLNFTFPKTTLYKRGDNVLEINQVIKDNLRFYKRIDRQVLEDNINRISQNFMVIDSNKIIK